MIFFTDVEIPERCITPCGQDGLYEDHYWCYTTNSWRFCSLQDLTEVNHLSVKKGSEQGSYAIHTENDFNKRRVGKNKSFISKIIKGIENLAFKAQKAQKELTIFDSQFGINGIISRLTEKQSNVQLTDALIGVGMGAVVAALVYAGMELSSSKHQIWFI